MKTRLMFCLSALILLAISCDKEEPESTGETGELFIQLGLNIVEKDASPVAKAVPQLDDFRVVIFLADGTQVMSFNRAADLPESIELPTGDYFVEAYSDNDLPAEFENPYYYGLTQVFSIESNVQQSVAVSCSLANTMVSVAYSARVIEDFLAYSTTVSSSLGSLVYTMAETRAGYFRTAALDILVNLSYEKPDGSTSEKSLSGSIPQPEPGKHYEIMVDAGIDEGQAVFQILVDSMVPVEIVLVDDSQAPAPDGDIPYGALIISEIMANPSALSDTDGEWFEIYNASGLSIDLQGLVLRRDDSNEHTISESLVIAPGDYCVLQRSAGATSAVSNYVYGSAITLTNSGAVLEIYNTEENDSVGPLIFSLDYGASGFPTADAASICLNPDYLDPTAALNGANWCTSSSVFSTGDLGTPAMLNDICQ